jgi:DNA-binding MarR family transcriptional regulator
MIPEILENSLAFNINRVALLLRRELIRALSEYNMPPEQWTIMATLWSTGKPLIQKEITELTLSDRHTVSRMIARLEKNGWIEKVQSEKDGRSTLIKPKPGGLALKNEVYKKLSSHTREIQKSIPQKEKDQLLPI